MADLTSSLEQRILSDLHYAMRNQDHATRDAIRLLTSAIKQWKVDTRPINVSDEDILVILNKEVKKRRDSATQYQQAGRKELADKEEFEIQVIQRYLPEQIAAQELQELIDEAFAATAAKALSDLGKLMAFLKPKIQGRADLSAVTKVLKERLSA